MEGEIKEKKKERKFEILMGQLLLIVVIGILIAIFIGFQMGKEVGASTAISSISVEKPDYCTVDKFGSTVRIRCNELTDISLDQFCSWISPELKNKVRIMLIP